MESLSRPLNLDSAVLWESAFQAASHTSDLPTRTKKAPIFGETLAGDA